MSKLIVVDEEGVLVLEVIVLDGGVDFVLGELGSLLTVLEVCVDVFFETVVYPVVLLVTSTDVADELEEFSVIVGVIEVLAAGVV